MSALATEDISAVETGPMSAAETGQMSAVETRQMSAAETGQSYLFLIELDLKPNNFPAAYLVPGLLLWPETQRSPAAYWVPGLLSIA